MRNSHVGARFYSEAAFLKSARRLFPEFAFSKMQGLIVRSSISHCWWETEAQNLGTLRLPKYAPKCQTCPDFAFKIGRLLIAFAIVAKALDI